MADDWQQVGKRGRGGAAPAANRGASSPSRGQDHRGGGLPHHRGRGGRGRGHRGRGNAGHAHKAPAAADTPKEAPEEEEGDNTSSSEEIEYHGQLLLADDSPEEASMSADEPPSSAPAPGLVASSSRKAEDIPAEEESEEEEGDDSDADIDEGMSSTSLTSRYSWMASMIDCLNYSFLLFYYPLLSVDERCYVMYAHYFIGPVVLPRREEPLQDLVRQRLGLGPKATEPIVLQVL